MTARNYSNTASAASAAVVIGASDTSAALADFSGFPDPPFVAVIDKDTADEEIVLVTNVAGSTVTITRAYDGTTAKAHSSGASFRHIAAAIDFSEANDHVNGTSGVHGVSGSVVGTSDEQTLTNKTLTAPAISNPTVTGTLSGVTGSFSGTVSGLTGAFTDLTVSDDAAITGDLDVDGATTLGTLSTSGAAQLASAAVTGNVTVGGTLGVTGALSGDSAAFSGDVSAATATLTDLTSDEIELEQQASNPGSTATGHSSLFAKTDFGLYFRPSSQTARRAAMHWGSGTSLPGTGKLAGDTFYHSDLGSLLRYNGTNWRQIDGPVGIANMAARPTHADLHEGFQVFDLSTDRTYTYDGTYWRTDGTGGHTPPGASAGDYITAISDSTTDTTSSSGGINVTHGHTFSQAPVLVFVTAGSTGAGSNVRSALAEQGNHTTTAVNLRFYEGDGTAVASSLVRANYTVIGRND